MISKTLVNSHREYEALNLPKWDFVNTSLIKVASIQKDVDLPGFDLEAALKDRPEHLFVKVFAIKKDEVNDNGDAFSEAELKKAVSSFVGVPVFCNHQNDDIEKARGSVVHAWYDDERGGIYIVSAVDKIAYPKLARGIEEGYINGCFPPDAPVLMADGTEKSIVDIENGDYVISGKGNIRKVLGKRQRGYNYPLLSLKVEGNKQPIVSTGHHSYMVYKLPDHCACGCGSNLPRKRDILIGGDLRLTAKTFGRRFKTGHNLRPMKIEHQFIQKVKACDLKIGDILLEPKIIDKSKDSLFTEDEAFLIGLFIAEGSFEKREGIRSSVIFNFGSRELETIASVCETKLCNVFRNHSNRPTVNFYPEASQSRICLYGEEVADWFYKYCGEYSDGKVLHTDLLKMGRKKTAALIAGYIEGDGCSNKGEYVSSSSVSPKFSSQLRILLEKLGVRTRYKISLNDKEKKIRLGSKPSHEVSFGISNIPEELNSALIYKKVKEKTNKSAKWHQNEEYALRRIKDIQEFDFNGTIYDLEVEEDHTYCVNHIAVSNTSMGAQVQYSCCSICHNRASTPDEYCLVGDTSILLSDFTVKPISEISIGDEVIDAFGKKTKVVQLFKRDIKEKISVIKSRNIVGEILATKNHPFLVKCRGEYKYHPSEYLDDKQELFTPVSMIEESNEFFDIYDSENKLSTENQNLLVRMLGYYAAEGCIIKRDGKAKAVEFSLHEDENEFAEELSSSSVILFNKKPYDYSLNNKDGNFKKCRRIRIWNEKAAQFFDTVCGGNVRNRNKKFHKSVFGLSKEMKISLLSTFINGDGYSDPKGHIQLVSACHPLISQCFYLALQSDLSPSINSYKNSGGPSCRHKESLIYRMGIGRGQTEKLIDTSGKIALAQKTEIKGNTPERFTEDGLFAKHNAYSIEEVDFEGPVYNFETESHSYVANNTSVHNCEHVRRGKNKNFSGKLACAYFKSKNPTGDKCPVCKEEKGSEEKLEHKQAQVYEHNFGIKFIEDSFVVNPACHDCLVDCVLNVPEINVKVSNFKNKLSSMISTKDAPRITLAQNEYQSLIKAASIMEEVHCEEAVTLSKYLTKEVKRSLKTAGKIELEKLNEAMGLMEIVARSMMDQKQQVSLEYVSDVVEVLADLQSVTDELTEMGYGALPSSPKINEYTMATGQPAMPVQGQVPPQQAQPQQPQMAPPTGGASSSNGLATITKPTTAQNKIEDLVKEASTYSERIEELRHKVVAALVSQKNTAIAGDDSSNKNINKESETNMNIPNEKTAAGPGQSQYSVEVTTEKRLEDAKSKSGVLHPRTDTSPEGITEGDSQLGRKDAPTDVTSKSPQTRLGTYETITEDQLATIKEGYLARFNEFPEVITEKQWDEASRAIGAVLSEDQSTHITQSQLQDLLKNHTWAGDHNPDQITEVQIQKGGISGDLDPLSKSASVDPRNYIKTVVAAATNAIVDAISGWNKTPDEIIKAASFINKDPQTQIKAAFLTLINGMPTKIEARKAEVQRNAYFSKAASDVRPVDALIGCMGDHCHGIKTEDLVEAAQFIVSDKSAMSKVNALVKAKLADKKSDVTSAKSFDKLAAMREAVAEIAKEKDGLYQIEASVKEIGVPLTNKRAFVKAVEDYASTKVASEVGVDSIATKIKVDEKSGLVIATMKDVAFLTADEVKLVEAANSTSTVKTASTDRSTARAAMVKEAQGMPGMDPMGGGSAPGAAGAGAPAAGAPPAPGAPATPPVESFEQSGQTDPAGDTSDLEASPPGTNCPACTSEDVDVVDGDCKCKNCGAEWKIKVQLDVTKWPNVIDKGDDKGADGEDAGAGDAAAGADNGSGADASGGAGGFEMPEQGQDQPSIPVAAMTRIDAKILTKIAEVKAKATAAKDNEAELAKLAADVVDGGFGIKVSKLKQIANSDFKLGSVSPLTGSLNTISLADGSRMCLDTGSKYNVDFKIDQKDIRKPFMQVSWTPKVAGKECSSCNRLKKSFVSALASVGVDAADFKALDLRSRGELILAMKEKGKFSLIKEASKIALGASEMKKAYAIDADKFPSEQCREKIARRFGENAVAISGPCEGEKLADCVCSQLKKANVYAEYLAVKIADNWRQKEGMDVCLEEYIREAGFDTKEALTCCAILKSNFIQPFEVLAESFGEDNTDDTDPNGSGSKPNPFGGDDKGSDGSTDSGSDDDIDPFDGPEVSDTADSDNPSDDSTDKDDNMDATDNAALPVDGDGAATSPTDGAKPEEIQVSLTPVELAVLESLDKKIDEAKGIDPTNIHKDLPTGPVEVPLDDASGIEDTVAPVLDNAVEQAGDDVQPASGIEVDLGNGGGDVSSPVGTQDTGAATSGDPMNNGDKAMEDEKFNFAKSMRPGIGRTGKIGLDIGPVLAAVEKARQNKAAGNEKASAINKALERVLRTASEKELSVQPAQDTAAIKPYSKTDLGKGPDVPRGNATMGHEKAVDLQKAKIETGDQRLGHEGEHLKPELADKITGGIGGVGGEDKAASTKGIQSKLAERIVAANKKKAQTEVKVDHIVPTSETSGIEPIQNGKTMGHEKPFDLKKEEILQKGEGSFMGHEKESIMNVPKPTSEFAPEVPSKDGEKVDEVKGTVIASGDTKSQATYAEAFRIAGRMVAAGVVDPSKLMSKVKELSQYKLAQLSDYENMLFNQLAQKKAASGLRTVSGGAETAIVNYDEQRGGRSLTDRLKDKFTLSQRNDAAVDPNITDAELRKTFGRR